MTPAEIYGALVELERRALALEDLAHHLTKHAAIVSAHASDASTRAQAVLQTIRKIEDRLRPLTLS
jgi:ribosome-binding protein aMBF1 (putative translation factor)